LYSGLHKLDLSSNKIGGERTGEPGVHALADLLKNHGTLNELNVSHNRLDAECVQILAPVIASSDHTLSDLNLSNNEIEDEGAKCIAEALSTSNVSSCAPHEP
jgi:Ran GTPase-activating protein (RanGAP) involved in mRNA processing and transport